MLFKVGDVVYSKFFGRSYLVLKVKQRWEDGGIYDFLRIENMGIIKDLYIIEESLEYYKIPIFELWKG